MSTAPVGNDQEEKPETLSRLFSQLRPVNRSHFSPPSTRPVDRNQTFRIKLSVLARVETFLGATLAEREISYVVRQLQNILAQIRLLFVFCFFFYMDEILKSTVVVCAWISVEVPVSSKELKCSPRNYSGMRVCSLERRVTASQSIQSDNTHGGEITSAV